jgi:nucleoside-diphosphate-sugar epimerase
MSQETPLIILGGNGPSGSYLMRRLAAAGLTAAVVSRRPFDAPQGFTKLLVDLNNRGEWRAPVGAVIMSLLPLWVLTEFLPGLAQIKAVIAVSSTSRFSKTNSNDLHERSIAEKLATAEDTFQRWAESNGVLWTLLRPTLIYDGKTDRNVTRMARFIRRWHFLPIATPADGRVSLFIPMMWPRRSLNACPIRRSPTRLLTSPAVRS